MVPVLLTGALLVINLLISWWNARAAGSVWNTTRIVGGYQRFMAWVVAVMSAAGFTWVYTIIIGLVAFQTGRLNQESVELLFNLGFVVIAPVVLFGGYAITFDSWKRRIQTGRGTGFVAWNTAASAYNTYTVGKEMGGTVKSVIDGVRKNPQLLIVLGLFIIGLFGGALTTYWLVRHYAKKNDVIEVPRATRESGWGHPTRYTER